MNNNLKILLAAIFVACCFTQDKICEHLGFGQTKLHHKISSTKKEKELPPTINAVNMNHFLNDTIYSWDDQLLDWVAEKDSPEVKAQLISQKSALPPFSEPIQLDWKKLLKVKYRLKYFDKIDMEMYAPVFSKALKALHKQEVIIEGFVIPLDEEQEIASLSMNPYASCFFCGKASPASIISMYLKHEVERYKIDEFKKFKGILYLNSDDPDEFYYILRNAVEVNE